MTSEDYSAVVSALRRSHIDHRCFEPEELEIAKMVWNDMIHNLVMFKVLPKEYREEFLYA